jgi:cytidylate kinase
VGLFGDENILADIRSRDAFDAGRTVSPLRQAEDAVVLETDRLTPAEALEKALGAVSCALIRTRRLESGP